MKGQYWKENCIAINDDDNLIYVTSAVKTHDEPIVLKITSCDFPNAKTHFTRKLTIDECRNLAALLADIADHQEKMQNE